MKLRVRSDGTPAGTHVFDEHGNEIRGVQRVLLVIDVKEPRAHAVVTIVGEHDADVELDGSVVSTLRRREGPLAELFAKTAEDESGGES